MAIVIKRKYFNLILYTLGIIILGCILYFFVKPYIFNSQENKILDDGNQLASDSKSADNATDQNQINSNPVYTVDHIATPVQVKALYMSSWIAGVPTRREKIVKIADDTEINSIVIDIKDATGRVAFKTDDKLINEIGSTENRVKDMKSFIDDLHKKDIYVIGRISVFQDPYLAKVKPEWAITRKSDGKVWKDRKGLSFMDPAKPEVREYVVRIAKASYALGFDEINFDYIRYPSDGDLKNIDYHLKEGVKRADNIEFFFKNLSLDMKKETNIPISGDLFGLTTEVEPGDDMGIGQVWEKALPYFDFLCPMIYPSHYPAGQYGFANPAAHPKEVIDHALNGAINKTVMMNLPLSKIRPWLQDFDMGAKYTADMVRAQIDSSENNGIISWMFWDPKNVYTPSAFYND
ncbi:MAG: hypothetical protein NTX85_03145 [Candidatus Nomurabacteria bacterium]|nr:hypothetical protein [Candidatus Nomurabacteria bacterium]